MKRTKLSPRQTIILFVIALFTFTTMACAGGGFGDPTCLNCEISQEGGF